MFFTYHLITQIVAWILPVSALFSPKMKDFIQGRKRVWELLKKNIQSNDKIIWFHAASLGEYEQGLPIMKRVKQQFPEHKIVLTFFSPSGYNVRKNSPFADVVCYLPLDTFFNAKRFVRLVHPEKVFFVKYEYWPNYLKELKKHHIPTYLVSGIFRENQVFFEWYGGFYRNCLQSITHFFVQDVVSENLLKSIGKTNVSVSGDTRFDRVVEVLNANNSLDFITEFTQRQTTVVIGSSWPADEKLLVEYINQSDLSVKWIFAPHNIKSEQIQQLKKTIQKAVVLYSEKDQSDLKNAQVLIIDAVGFLTKVYAYADVAYVGGGFGSGIHNVLEPAVFGVPIVIGPQFQKFKEAVDLVGLGACIVVNNQQELQLVFDKLFNEEECRIQLGKKASDYVLRNAGAAEIILRKIK